MMKQPFIKFGVTTLFSLLCSTFLHAQVVTDERMFSFEKPQIPDCITATHSRLSVSDLHYKDGKHSLEWTFEPGGILELKKDLKFEKKDPTGKDLYLSAFIVWVYNEVPQNATIEFQFLKDGKRCTSFPFGINFSGWRAAWVCYERDMQGTPEEGMNELRIIAPNSKGTLFIDHLITATKVDARQQTADLQVPFVNAGTTNHWLVVYQHSLLKPDIELTPVDDKQRAEMQLLEKRFRDMIYTKGKITDKEVENIRKKYDFYQITYKNGQVSGVPIYMVRAAEAYERIIPDWNKDMLTKMGVEMRAYFDLMKRIAVAYNNSTAKPVIREEMKKKFLAMYDHITDQGVAYGSCWGNIHHYGYSVRGLYLAYFLMKDVLREAGKLQEAERTLRWYAITNEVYPKPEVDGIDMDSFNTQTISYEDQQDSFRDLGTLAILIVVLVFIVMAAQFESLTYPFIIMFSLPFAFSGVLMALFFTNSTLSVMSLLGGIMLIGIVVKNGIVLIDYITLCRERGLAVLNSVVTAGKSRLRPVLMTTATTVLGMIPMAIGGGQGSEMWSPMAIAVIGGLTISTVLTLILIPTLYCVFAGTGIKNRRRKLRRQRELDVYFQANKDNIIKK